CTPARRRHSGKTRRLRASISACDPMKNFLAMIRKSLLRYDFSLPLQPEADPIAADTREGCRGNPLWLPLRAGTGACPYNLNPLPPMDLIMFHISVCWTLTMICGTVCADGC